MSDTFTLTPIGRITCTRTRADDDNWDAEKTTITLDPDVLEQDAAAQLDSFSHIEVIYLFDQVPDEKIVRGARHPRGNRDWPQVGILAQRGKNRPNRLGATMCKLLSVDGLTVEVAGLDAIDGTPVLDLKPVMTEFLPRGPVHQPDWSRELMKDYWAAPASS